MSENRIVESSAQQTVVVTGRRVTLCDAVTSVIKHKETGEEKAITRVFPLRQWQRNRSKYMPHQGKQECQRRMKRNG